MALLAEEIVEEWLNRQGYFTIRGIKMGVQEIDLLAVKRHEDGKVECRHIEVQASMRPVSPISQVPRHLQKDGRSANSAKRTEEELKLGVAEWIEKKFGRTDKKELMSKLWDADWSSELIVHEVKSEEELDFIASHGIKVHRLSSIVTALQEGGFTVKSASGADMVDLILMGVRSQR